MLKRDDVLSELAKLEPTWTVDESGAHSSRVVVINRPDKPSFMLVLGELLTAEALVAAVEYQRTR